MRRGVRGRLSAGRRAVDGLRQRRRHQRRVLLGRRRLSADTSEPGAPGRPGGGQLAGPERLRLREQHGLVDGLRALRPQRTARPTSTSGTGTRASRNYDWFFWGGVRETGSSTAPGVGGLLGWQHVSLDLTGYLGDSSVWIAFVFHSDSTNDSDDGPFVDDITLYAYSGAVTGSGPTWSTSTATTTSRPAAVDDFLEMSSVGSTPRWPWSPRWTGSPATTPPTTTGPTPAASTSPRA